MKKSYKQQLLQLGMGEHQFDHSYADLQVMSTPISDKWVKENTKLKVSTFTYNDEKWYDIQDGYIQEYTYSITPFRNVSFERISKPNLLKELSDKEYQYLDSILTKVFLSNNFAYTSTSSFAAFWCNENPKSFGEHRFIEKFGSTLRAFTLSEDKQFIAMYEDKDEKSTYYIVKVSD